jgi:aspartyl-tRNA(Asn)/glutamyl-tRNA(Gln) amidotransferase subunit A
VANVRDATSIDELGRQLRARELSAAELLETCLRRIDAEDRNLNAFIRVMAEEARGQAAEADRDLAAGRERGPLHGIPIAVKDLIDIKGLPTTAASRVRDGHRADADAAVVTQLRRAGAIVIGKTNLHEFAYGTTSEDSAFGPVRNPHDASRSPGGSSGGSAVAVAAGMAVAALGTDTGGSVRIPAAACGTVGLKPTYGEVSVDGVVPLSRTLDHVGSLARTVSDAWLLHRVLVGHGEHQPVDAAPVGALRLAVPRAYFCELLDGEVGSEFEATLDRLRQAGAHVDEVSIPHAAAAPAVYIHIHAAEAAEYHAWTLDTAADRYTPNVRLRLEMGRYILAEDHVRARIACEYLRREVDAALEGHDVLLLPTLPIPAPRIGVETLTIAGSEQPVRALMLRCTQLFNLTGHPALSMPCGTTSHGLPCGLQLVGRRFETDALLRVALAVETISSPVARTL